MAVTTITVSAHSFLTEDDAKLHVLRGATLSGDQANVFRLDMNSALALMEAYTGRKLASRAYTDLLLDSYRANELRFDDWPLTELTALSSVADDGTRTAIDISGAEYDYDNAVVYLRNNVCLPIGEARLEADVTLGYDSTAHPTEWALLSRAQAMLTALEWQRHQIPNLTAESVAGPGRASLALRSDALPDEVRGMLAPFVRVGR